MSLRELLEQDSTFQKHSKLLEDLQAETSLVKIRKEAEFLHLNRPSRSLYSKEVGPNRLRKAILQDLSNRARMTELKTSLFMKRELLETSMKATRNHINSRYRSSISKFAGTQADKAKLMDKILEDGVLYLSKLTSTIEVIDMFIKDIDQAGYALKNTTDLLKMVLDRKEGQV
jgi:hypothetical protein